ncbi:MAG: hypothetical protein AB2L07_00325 [Thermoanaerobaculaceae bacterium]
MELLEAVMARAWSTTVTVLVALTLIPATVAAGASPASVTDAASVATLEGCPAVSKAAEGLARLMREPWGRVSFERHQELWPSSATRLTSQDGSSIVAENEDRVIAGACLCCTRAVFRLGKPGISPRLTLHNVDITQAFAAYQDAVAAGRQLLSTLALPPDASEFGQPWEPSVKPSESFWFFKWKAPAGVMSGWISVGKVDGLWGTALSLSVATDKQPAQPYALLSGRIIRLQGVEKEQDPTPTLVVSYISDCRFSQHDCADEELQDILPEFRLEAEAQDCRELEFRISDDWGGGQTRFYCKQDDGTWNEECYCVRDR